MKEKLGKAFGAAKRYLSRAKQILTHFETTLKAAGVAAVGGGVEAVWAQVHTTGHVVFNATQFVELKAHFLSGAAIAIIFWLKQAPALKQPTQPQA